MYYFLNILIDITIAIAIAIAIAIGFWFLVFIGGLYGQFFMNGQRNENSTKQLT